MSPALLWLAILSGLVLGVAALQAMARHGRQSRHGERKPGSDLHGSNANFGNSLQGDNSNFGRGFYDE
jgi:hypothetical protein